MMDGSWHAYLFAILESTISHAWDSDTNQGMKNSLLYHLYLLNWQKTNFPCWSAPVVTLDLGNGTAQYADGLVGGDSAESIRAFLLLPWDFLKQSVWANTYIFLVDDDDETENRKARRLLGAELLDDAVYGLSSFSSSGGPQESRLCATNLSNIE